MAIVAIYDSHSHTDNVKLKVQYLHVAVAPLVRANADMILPVSSNVNKFFWKSAMASRNCNRPRERKSEFIVSSSSPDAITRQRAIQYPVAQGHKYDADICSLHENRLLSFLISTIIRVIY